MGEMGQGAAVMWCGSMNQRVTPAEASTAWQEPMLGNGERTEGKLDKAGRRLKGLSMPIYSLIH